MFIVRVCLNDAIFQTYYLQTRRDTQTVAIDWSRNKHTRFGRKIPFGDFKVEVFDITKPVPANEREEKPIVYF